MNLAIEINNLRKTYSRGPTALKDLSLDVPKGICFGLLGPNGAGKSTLVKSLLTIVRADSGQAELLGRDFRDPESRRSVGYLPEGHNFPKYLTGQSLCRYFGKLAGLGGSELDAEVEEKLGMVGMAQHAKTKITKYSKGMKQRAGLAQALIGNPELVFLDEPTDGVDPIGRQEIRAIIAEYAERGATIFLNSHLLSEVEQSCSLVGIMNHGSLIKLGSVEEITASVGNQDGSIAVAFECSRIPDALWDRFCAQGDQKGKFSILVKDKKEISKFIDDLRSAQVDIFSIKPTSSNLEDAFIQLITSEEGAES